MFVMPELPGAVVVYGGGYAARRLAGIPWIQAGHVRIRSEGNVRLEQERIAWAYALPRLLALVAKPR